MIDFSFENETYNLGGFEIILKPVSKNSNARFDMEHNPTDESMYDKLEDGTFKMKEECFKKHYVAITTLVQQFLIANCVSIQKGDTCVGADQWFDFFDKALDVAEFREFVEGYKSGQKKT